MNTQSNTYTFLYAAIMVVVVAALLSFAAMSLKPMQDKNVEVEKKKSILSSVSLGLDADEQENKNSYIESLYDKYIVDSYIVNSKGEKVKGEAFTVDLKKELDKPVESRKLPVFVSKQDDGTKNYILPVRGKGLWGPIWGYVALKNDYNTIVGASFDHKSETPGLGAEINTTEFEQQFVGKKLFNKDNEFVSVDVVKGGAPDDDPHAVDAISGGTITSNGLDAMLEDNLGSYVTYFKQQQK
ncbi:NADH:ubiquinone reductase (Na(+)-transporting) subunit C [Salinivirga cyanobacteriivorans]|uniref:Na(+)-translocating NADH-quinone reductase subunit C n=1 Tax=Salinivirga cyanobacteriivorans TaxID=1307839 RepID=A0A0S2I500_9BACT|nr:NADH:ubiquinone reductase (Na(+)-transporting) subunit C [Salinivirga cyanobacteriivorans]ALO17409.1 Na(+)-translocating NADH-quinone reductase subunit C [Salinivirga cyanobacteriivorans]